MRLHIHELYIPGVLNTGLGLWVMVSSAVFGYGRPENINDYTVGPLILSFAFISIWSATRDCRWVNTVLGGWLAVSTFFLPYPLMGTINMILTGCLVVLLSIPEGRHRKAFGGGWRQVWAHD